MEPEALLAAITKTRGPAASADVKRLEDLLGASLPSDYRSFLIASNGGFAGGKVWFKGPTPTGEAADAGVHHIGGFREESHFSLAWARGCYEGRIPGELMWIMDDPFGNAICLGLRGSTRGKVYFWNHEHEPGDEWDGSLSTAGNVQLLAASFSEFVHGLQRRDV